MGVYRQRWNASVKYGLLRFPERHDYCMVAPPIPKGDQYDVVVKICWHVFEECPNLSCYVEALKQCVGDLVSACSWCYDLSGGYQLVAILASQPVSIVQGRLQRSLVYDIAMEDQILCFVGKKAVSVGIFT